MDSSRQHTNNKTSSQASKTSIGQHNQSPSDSQWAHAATPYVSINSLKTSIKDRPQVVALPSVRLAEVMSSFRPTQPSHSLNSLTHATSLPLSDAAPMNNLSAYERHSQLYNSSQLYNVSSVPSQPVQTNPLSEDVYRAVDLSSSMLQTPDHNISNNPHQVLFEDFDNGSFHHRMKLQEPAQTNMIKNELHSITPVMSLSSLSEIAALKARLIQPLVLQPAPSFVERYTSFYSHALPQSLVDCIGSFFASKSIDFEFNREKTKFCVSFLCPVFMSLSVSFNVRLFTSSPKEHGLLICEIQRRDGCAMGFNYVYTMLVDHIKQNNMFAKPFTSCPMSTLPDSQPHSIVDVGVLSLSVELDDEAFQLLVNLIDRGDAHQQSDAIRVLGQCLRSPSDSHMSKRLPDIVGVIRSTLINQTNNPQRALHEEKAIQVTRLVSMLLSSQSKTCSLNRTVATDLIPPMISLLAVVLADVTLTKLKIVRFIMETLNSLTMNQESLGSLKHALNEREIGVLDQCCDVKDNDVSRLASTVSHRLATATI